MKDNIPAVEKPWVLNWIGKMAINEIAEILTDLINGTYTVEQLNDDFDEWMIQQEPEDWQNMEVPS